VCECIGNIADRKILKDLCSTPLHVALQHHYYSGLQIYRLIARTQESFELVHTHKRTHQYEHTHTHTHTHTLTNRPPAAVVLLASDLTVLPHVFIYKFTVVPWLQHTSMYIRKRDEFTYIARAVDRSPIYRGYCFNRCCTSLFLTGPIRRILSWISPHLNVGFQITYEISIDKYIYRKSELKSLSVLLIPVSGYHITFG
jgi:hypothetical protein